MLFDLDKSIDGNLIRHVFSVHMNGIESTEFQRGRTITHEIRSETGQTATIVRSRISQFHTGTETIFLRQRGGTRCIATSLMLPLSETKLNEIKGTWRTRLSLKATEGRLRIPQRGALHALLAHSSKSAEPATIVLPTGTGKTETLLLTILTRQPKKTLVLVPTDPLREQTYDKACTWGRLAQFGVLPENSVQYPVVGKLRKSFSSLNDAERFFHSCQVVVATVTMIKRLEDTKHLSENDFDLLLKDYELIVVDEAHHLGASTWKRVRDRLSGRLIVQFTATPFRHDGKEIGGEIIYTYPLARAQSEEFFSRIRFRSICNYDPDQADRELAENAVEQLREDIGNGLEHALMARAKTKERANSLIGIYREIAGDLNPVILHTGLSPSERNTSKTALLNGESSIIVCVDMLGEGFDYPNLKIAALHDIHKTLPITLQFIGRFTRTAGTSIGDASVFANIADTKVLDALTILYSQDSDWNKLIQATYDDIVEREVSIQDFLRHFRFDNIDVFPLSNIYPKFTVFLYRTSENAELSRLSHNFNDGAVHRLALNQQDGVAVVVSRLDSNIDWGKIASLQNTNFVCTAFFLDEEHKLLFVFSSDKGDPKPFVTVVDPDHSKFKDRAIYRCLHGVNRLLLTNLGLRRTMAGPIRYRQYIGADVGAGIQSQVREGSYTAMLFGTGYEDASRVTIGCSQKGRIWSRNGGRILEWVEWCRSVAAKLADETINIDEIFDGMLFSDQVDEIPAERTPIGVDWGDFFFSNMIEKTDLLIEGEKIPIENASLSLRDLNNNRNALKFDLEVNGNLFNYTLTLTRERTEGYEVRCDSEKDIAVAIGSKVPVAGKEFFINYPPVFWLDNCSCLYDGCLLIQSSQDDYGGSLSHKVIEEYDWQGVNIQVESQGPEKRTDSIQRRIIEEIEETDAIVIFDDDGSGEMADIVAIYNEKEHIMFRLYHCKFSSEAHPGCRLKDVYEVACQAQKSVKWANSAKTAIDHLERRELRRRQAGAETRFERGNVTDLRKLQTALRSKPPAWEVVLVQPGLSKQQVTVDADRPKAVLRVLGATQAYLSETYNMGLRLLVSP